MDSITCIKMKNKVTKIFVDGKKLGGGVPSAKGWGSKTDIWGSEPTKTHT